MYINCFEEYPDAQTLRHLELLPANTIVYLGSKSLGNFRDHRAHAETINPHIIAAYWPILKESYWVSPFSQTYELEQLYKELAAYRDSKSLIVLLDLELPICKPSLLFENLFSYFKNRRIIERIISLMNIQCVSAEYSYAIGPFSFLPRLWGISYPKLMQGNRILMYYSSMKYPRLFNFLFDKARFYSALEHALEADPDIAVGVGTLATGVYGNEPILSPKALHTDLSDLRRIGVKEAVLFRLGGITRGHMNVVSKFTNI